jgi:hypothetical protein
MTDRLGALLITVVLYVLSAAWTVSEDGWTAKAFLGAFGVMLVAAVVLLLVLWLIIGPMVKTGADIIGALGDLKALFKRRR